MSAQTKRLEDIFTESLMMFVVDFAKENIYKPLQCMTGVMNSPED